MNCPKRRRFVFALVTTLVSACGVDGFHLRRPQTLSYERIGLSGFTDRSTMVEEIRRALPAGAVITANVLESEVIIEALADTRETTVEASTAFGQVRELRLHVLLRYRVLRPDGTELLKTAELERFRDLTYNESVALAKDTELKTLYRDMQADMATQLVRVLAALGKPNGTGSATANSNAASGAAAGERASNPAFSTPAVPSTQY